MRATSLLRRWHQTVLPNRSFLRIQGPDSGIFLQGLVTNSLSPLSHSKSSLYSAILNSTGRVLFDVFFYPITPSETPIRSVKKPTNAPTKGKNVEEEELPMDYIMEFEGGMKQELLDFLGTYVLRSRVRYRIESNLECRVVWNSSPSVPSQALSLPEDYQPDPRLPSLGFRTCVPSSAPSLPDDEFMHSSPLAYSLHRILNGVPEGPHELQPGVALPLEAGLGDLHGVDYKKGCYVGQELTARTHYRGLVRKRFAPVRIWKEGDVESSSLLEKEEEWEAEGEVESLRHLNLTPLVSSVKSPRPSGRLLSVLNARRGDEKALVGLALVRTDDERKGDGVVAAVRGEEGNVNWMVKSWRRSWWKDGTDEPND
ncbi:Aminomethyltransferase folate-binding domain-containing protein [Atractiella rhizophila]|nr:Aminomethyltransferase folate-binding domain-containing protein [Atractiella rhizophila]